MKFPQATNNPVKEDIECGIECETECGTGTECGTECGTAWHLMDRTFRPRQAKQLPSPGRVGWLHAVIILMYVCMLWQGILNVVIVKWFAFLNKRLQRGRDGHSGNEVGTLRRDMQI